MTEVYALRPGARLVHTAPAGSSLVALRDGRFLITHRDFAPYVVNPDGSTQHLAIYDCDERWRHQ